ncbi:MAG: EAL domain-containing protein [Acidimicrobiales bacterium]|nr:EAL domain-containing protein [Acidimicrobiales bacterium]
MAGRRAHDVRRSADGAASLERALAALGGPLAAGATIGAVAGGHPVVGIAALAATAAPTLAWFQSRRRARAAMALVHDRAVGLADELREAEQALARERSRARHRRGHDAVTELPNRRGLFEALEQPAPSGTTTWLILVDLDNFRTINDSAGHSVGDEVLRIAAGRLQRVLPVGTLLARLGGDEFAVLCRTKTELGAPTDIAEAILAALRAPFVLDEGVYRLDGSAGIAMLHDGDTAGTLLRDADVAMYAAKAAGRGRWVVHTERMAASSHRLRLLMPELHQAIERDEFVLHFQPVVRLEDAAVVGAEALVRWQHPVRGLVGPVEFIEVAEATGLIVPIGTLVLRKALATLRLWLDGAMVDPMQFRLNVNLSTRQLEQPGFVEELAVVLDEFDIDAELLTLEVTETSLLSSDEAVLSRLEGVREVGARLAIDDFGSGYAGFEYLKRGLFDVVKLDRSLVVAASERQDWAVARAVVALSEAMGFEVVAEGIEEPEQAAALAQLGCQKAQGYLFGRPVPSDRVVVAAVPQPSVD